MRISATRALGTLLIVISALACSDDPIGTAARLSAGTASASAGDGVVVLSATAPTGGQSPYAYQWHRSTTSGFTPGTSNAMSGFTSLEETDTGVTNGTTYRYKLVATDNAEASVTYNEASATPTVTSSDHSNEPSGFSEIVTNPFDQKVPSGWDLFGDDGEDLQVVSDANAPRSPSNVGAMYFPGSFVGGSGPASLQYSLSSEPSELYIHVWFKVSDGWQGHDSGVNKIFFIDNNEHSDVYFSAQGTDLNSLHFQVRTQNVVGGAVNYSYNHADNEVSPDASDAEIVRGQWHDIEVHLKLDSSAGAGDGEIHAWINGTKILQFTSASLIRSGDDTDYDRAKWGPVWGGGSADTVESDQYQYIDHLYVSGGG